MSNKLSGKNKFDLIILAGGRGSRISQYLKGIPKPMLKIKKFDFLEILLKNFSKYNLNKIFIAAGYKGKKIYQKYHNKKINLIDVECIIENKPLGTGGALNQFKNKTTKNFFVLNGDTFFDVNLNEIYKRYKHKKEIYLALSNSKNYKTNNKLTNLIINKNKKITYDFKSNYFNGGIYFFNNKIFKKIPSKNFSLENDLLPFEIKNKNVIGDYFNNFFLDIGTPLSIKTGLKKLIKHLQKPAIFLDRDGTLIYDKGYTFKLRDLKFKKKVLDFLKRFRNKFYIFIVTNQSGIGRGLYTEQDFLNFQINLKEKIYKKKGILIDDLRYCPFIHSAKLKIYKKKSKFRKPDNLMIKSLLNSYFINSKKSLMIGNSHTDQLCAKKSNLKYIDVDKI